MIVTAMLAWWDEPPEELAACVTSMRVLCDKVVAVDGAYQMTRGATAISAPEQAAAIRDAAEQAGIEAVIFSPPDVWTGQVEKRDFMLREAAADADWLLAIDSDHRLRGQRGPLRRELAGLADDIVSVRHDFHTPLPTSAADIASLSPHQWHTNLAGKTIEHSLLIRCLGDMQMERDHWGYSGVLEGRRIALGNWRNSPYPQGRSVRLGTPFRIDHLCFDRDQMRLDRNRDYCRVRDAFKRQHGYEP